MAESKADERKIEWERRYVPIWPLPWGSLPQPREILQGWITKNPGDILEVLPCPHGSLMLLNAPGVRSWVEHVPNWVADCLRPMIYEGRDLDFGTGALRVRKGIQDDGQPYYGLTVKQKHPNSFEWPQPERPMLTAEQFEVLWPHVSFSLTKLRRTIGDAAVDQYFDRPGTPLDQRLEGVVIVEVEFPDQDAYELFVPTERFLFLEGAIEVTHDTAWSNMHLAKYGPPLDWQEEIQTVRARRG